jgi:hypothetical protein
LTPYVPRAIASITAIESASVMLHNVMTSLASM